jgi:hypothetical protein
MVGLQGGGVIGACCAARLGHRSPGRHPDQREARAQLGASLADQPHDSGVGAPVDHARPKGIGERGQSLLEQGAESRELRFIEPIGASDQHYDRSGTTEVQFGSAGLATLSA